MEIIGATIKEVHPISDAELARLGWELYPVRGRPVVIGLSNKAKLVAGSDPEGNGYGVTFGHDGEEHFGLPIFPASAAPTPGDLVGVTGATVAEVRAMTAAEMADNYRNAPQCPVRKGGGVAALGPKARLASARNDGGPFGCESVSHP